MELLILGGTRFLGRHLVEAAIAREHQVTLFNRGQSNPHLFPDLEQLRGDRDGHLDALKGRSWDAVIDTSGYVPRVVRATAEMLKGAIGHYTFISTISVYADLDPVGIREDAPLASLPDPSTEDVAQFYGGLKVACEGVLDELSSGKVLHVRPGLIVGPHDPTERFTYWVRRMAEGGEVLVPRDDHQPIQVIDARDLALWIVQQVERQQTGVYNAAGPQQSLTLANLLKTCQVATGTTAQLTWVDPTFLAEHRVEPWTDLPLWLGPEMPGFFAVNAQKAFQDGLAVRPLEDTIRDTWTWAQSSPTDLPQSPHHSSRPGLERSRERQLLQTWHTRLR